jgi:hypothetical protein
LSELYLSFGLGIALGVAFTVIVLWPVIRWKDDD